MKLKTSPSGTPSRWRSRRARSKLAPLRITICARSPEQFAGERRNTRAICSCILQRQDGPWPRPGYAMVWPLVMSIPPRALLASPPRVLSLGLPLFASELERLGVAVTHLDWRPPAGADARLAGTLERLEQRRPVIEQANAVALQRLV